ncbi:MAG: hypothetical protein ACYDB9_10430 [Gammaproteobacteria bacterium]
MPYSAANYFDLYAHARPTLAAAIMACLMSGTGGANLPYRYVDGTSISPLFTCRTDSSIGRQLSDLIDAYKLGKDQLASILAVSRPTIYAWLNNESSTIRAENKERIAKLSYILKEEMPSQEHASLLGPFLRRRLNVTSQDLWDALTASIFNTEKLHIAFIAATSSMEGQRRDNRLSELLQNVSPLT